MAKKLGHYEVVSELGRGGMGVVYKAYEASLDRHVAIKVLSDQMANDPVVVARFQREARSVAALNHPHITQIFFIGESEGQHFFVMEFIEGESLSAYIRREHPLAVPRALTILKQAAEGLAAAHGIGVIHRDIKPANIMLDGRGHVKIADFGIAYTQDLQNKLTATGQFLGTPGYLSPEVCMGETADARTDIFSLGVVFFEMLTGKVPFHADSPLAMLSKVVREAIPNVRELNAEVEPEIQAILTKMVEKIPDHRYQSCEALIEDIDSQISKVKTIKATRSVSATAATEAISIPATLADDASANPPSGPAIPPPPVPVAAARATAEIQAPPIQAAAPPAPPVMRQESVMAPQRPVDRSSKRKGGWLIPAFLFLLLPLLALSSYVAWKQFKPKDEGESGIIIAGLETPDPSHDQPGGELAVQDTNASGQSIEFPKPAGQSEPGDNPIEPPQEETPGENDAQSTGPSQEKPAEQLGTFSEEGPESTSFESSQEEPGREASTTSGSNKQLSPETNLPRSNKKLGSLPQGEVQSEARQAGLKNVESTPVTAEKERILGKPLSKPIAETPAEVLPVNDTPQVVLVVHGDSWIGDTVTTELQTALTGHNFDLIDASMFDDLDAFLGDSSVKLGGLSKSVRSQGADILVLAEIKFLGERELRYMGRSSTAYKSALAIRSIDLATRKSLGASLRTELEYTQLNATQKAEEASNKLERNLVKALRQAADDMRK